MLHLTSKINSFDNRKFPKTIVDVLTDVYAMFWCHLFKIAFFHLISAANMTIDFLYPVNMHVIGISLREIDIYILKMFATLFVALL